MSSIILNRYYVKLLNQTSNTITKRSQLHSLERELFLFSTLFKDMKDDSNNNNNNNNNVNQNIDLSLYDYKTFTEMDEHFRELEMLWNTRLLFQNTPYGHNIIMYYDLYRQAFAYYSDVQMNYDTLNLCAMKYVRIFFCRDFFVDSHILPTIFISPFNQMKEREEKREKEEKLKKRKEKQIDFDSSVFVQKNSKTTITNDNKSKTMINDKPIYKNNFRYLGKIANCSITQPISFALTKKRVTISDHYEYINFKQSKETFNPSYSTFLHNLQELLE